VIDVAEEKPGKILHRAALLHELLEPIPKDRLHASNKLAAIQEQGKELRLKFDNGSEVLTHVLIGADGNFWISACTCSWCGP
jgi:salicylate hydroxylase